MKNPITQFLIAEIEHVERRLKKGTKKMSKLTDAITGLTTAVADLKKRVDDQDASDAATIATLTAENDAAATTIADLTAQIAALEVTPVP